MGERNDEPARKVQVLPDQLRAARAWLGWSRPLLAKAAGVSARTVAALELQESGGHRPKTVAAVVAALEQAGVMFTAHGVERCGP